MLVSQQANAYHDQLDNRYESWYQNKTTVDIRYFYDGRKEMELVDILKLSHHEKYRETMIFEKFYYDNKLVEVNLCFRLLTEDNKLSCY